MAKLWEKGYELDRVVEAFTVGDDPILDMALVKWDALGSMAHARMLAAIHILTTEEAESLGRELATIIDLDATGAFTIPVELEDVHTAIEDHLVSRLGDLGKKLHTARSRNDQVILDLRLYMRERVRTVARGLFDFVDVLVRFAGEHQDVPIPGRTHFQRAMPSSVGLWAGAFAESLLDDWALLAAAVRMADQCPLGSAASYGVNLDIDRQLVSDLLGFSRVQNNVLYVNNSRGKAETAVIAACAHICDDLSKLAADVILWSMPEFGYFQLPPEFCPGSSLMPQKRNPDPFELTRAKAATVHAALVEILDLTRPLISGYHRDFQLTKAPLMRALDTTIGCLRVNCVCFAGLQVDAQTCIDSFTPELFATDRVLELAKQGVPFRDAYRLVADTPEETTARDPVANIRAKAHLGAPGNLGLGLALADLEAGRSELDAMAQRWEAATTELIAAARGNV